MIRLYGLFVVFVLCIASPSDMQAQSLKKYMQQRKQELAERQKQEQAKYDALCEHCTLEKCKEYLSLYPNGMYVADVTNRIKDIELWNDAKSKNTISGYQNYIQNSQFKFFTSDANSAIAELQSIEAWKKIEHTNSISEINAFIDKYPNSSYLTQANIRKHEIMAVDYYNSGNLSLALYEFNQAGGKSKISAAHHSMYDTCMEYSEYVALKSTTNESDLFSFINKYPQSKYYNDVSNRIAILKAQSLTMYSTQSAYNSALYYAKDASTRTTVNSYIERSKKAYAYQKRQERRNRIMRNGGYVQIGVEAMDFALNTIIEDRWLSELYYNVGISVKVGNYKAPVQLEVGIKPGVIAWTYYLDDYYDGEEEMTSRFHMPIYARLKLNICNVGDECKFYIEGLGTYNAIRDDYLENEFSAGGGVGFAWLHWDWSFYCKAGLNNKDSLDDTFFGTSLVYYF